MSVSNPVSSLWRLAGVALFAASVLVVPRSEAEDWKTVDAFFTEYFRTHPTDVKSNGFKPWKRLEWFIEPRIYPDGEFHPEKLFRAWERLGEMEQTMSRGAETWYPLGPTNIAGRMKDIAIDPLTTSIIYAGAASGGIWKSVNSGASWVPLGDALPSLAVSTIALDPADPNTIYIGTGEGHFNIDAVLGVGVLKSTDAGVTWDPTGLSWDLSQRLAVNVLRLDPVNGTLLAATTNGVWRSVDTGNSWTQILTGTWTDIEFDPADPQHVLACHGNAYGSPDNGIWSSTDNGQTFTQLSDPALPPASDIGRLMLDFCEGTPTTIFCSISGDFGFNDTALIGVYRSTDGGATWALRASGPNFFGAQGWYDHVCEVHPTNPNTVYVGGVDLYRSTNGGATFANITDATIVHVDQHALAFDPTNPSIVYSGNDGGIYRSPDGGTFWADRNSDLATMQFYAMCQARQNPAYAMGGTQDNGTNRYTGSIGSWQHILGGDGGYCEVDYTTTNILYAELQFGSRRKSTNGGASWSNMNNGVLEDGAWVTPLIMHPQDHNALYTLTRYVYKTTNAFNWSRVSGLISGSAMIAIDICRDQPEWVYVIANARNVYYTDDDAVTWTAAATTGLPNAKAVSVAVDQVNPERAIIVFSGYDHGHVYETTNAGTTWTDITSNLPDLPTNDVVIDPLYPSHIYVGTDLGAFRSLDGGGTWEPFNNGLPNAYIDDMMIHEDGRVLRVATHGRGMWEVELTDVIAVDPSQIRPEPLHISRLFPNPLSGPTNFRFALRERADVRLAVYDVQGRLVDVLAEGEFAPGTHEAMWDVGNAAEGVYFLRLEGNGYSTARKLVVQK
jgi:photosystem II stability/assembly factor-like uncharacterized protein